MMLPEYLKIQENILLKLKPFSFFADPDVIQDVVPQNAIDEEERNTKRK